MIYSKVKIYLRRCKERSRKLDLIEIERMLSDDEATDKYVTQLKEALTDNSKGGIDD